MQVKNGGKHFWKQKFRAGNERLSMDSRGAQFFPFWEECGGKIFLLFPLVPIIFPICSHEVLQVPKLFTVAPHFYITCMLCPKFNSHVYKLKRWTIWSTFFSILQLAVQRGAFIGSAQCSPKKIGDGPINMTPSKKKKNSEPTHEVINMNHTMSPKFGPCH